MLPYFLLALVAVLLVVIAVLLFSRSSPENLPKLLNLSEITIEHDDELVSASSLALVIKYMSQTSAEALADMQAQFKAERLQHLSSSQNKYKAVVQKFLKKQEKIVRRVTTQTLEHLSIPFELFEQSLQRHCLDLEVLCAFKPEAAAALCPRRLTAAVYTDTLEFARSKWTALASTGQPLGPVEYTTHELHVSDETERTFGFAPTDLAHASAKYCTAEPVRSLEEEVHALKRKVGPHFRITSNQ